MCVVASVSLDDRVADYTIIDAAPHGSLANQLMGILWATSILQVAIAHLYPGCALLAERK